MTPPSSHSWVDRARLPARAAYVLVLLLATLTPFVPDPASAHVAERLARAVHPELARRDVVDGARNVVLFGGWGLIWALTGAGRVGRLVARATLTGAALSLIVEGLQLFSANRNASLLDVVTNTIGSLAGAAVLVLLVALAARRRGARSYVGVPAFLFAGGYGTAALLEAMIPLFRQDPVPGATGGPLARLATVLAAVEWRSLFDLTWSDLPIFLPAGAWAVLALAEHQLPLSAAFRRTLTAGAVLAVFADVLHAAMGLPIALGAIAIHAVAVAGGGWLAAATLSALTAHLRGPARPRALTLAYAAALAGWSLRPFLPVLDTDAITAKLAGRWYVPLAALSGRMDLFSVVDVCSPFFLYLPLGGLLAAWPCRRHGPLAGPLPAVWLALLLETSQLLIAGRMPDMTDFLVQAAGAAVGWAVLRRAGYPVYGETFPAPAGQ